MQMYLHENYSIIINHEWVKSIGKSIRYLYGQSMIFVTLKVISHASKQKVFLQKCILIHNIVTF